MRRFRRCYGAHPLHLIALLASFALAGYAARQLLVEETAHVVGWFVGSAIAHDLLLFPLYAGLDAAMVTCWRRRPGPRRGPPWINYVRFPVAISLLLLLVFSPEITRRSPIYAGTTDLSSAPYLGRWLLVSAALFLLSALAYAARLARMRSRR